MGAPKIVEHTMAEYRQNMKPQDPPANPLIRIVRYHVQCTGITVKGLRCEHAAVGGTDLCAIHQKDAISSGRAKLLSLINPALTTLEDCLSPSVDDKVRLAAAKIILDRTGFGPSMTMRVTEETEDLSALSIEELRARRDALVQRATKFVGSGSTDGAADTSVPTDAVEAQIEEAEEVVNGL